MNDTSKSLFLCGGLLKSGTTFLQRMLNSHPEVYCPPEHNLNTLFKSYLKIHEEYNQGILMNANLFGLEGEPIDKEIFLKNYFSLVKDIIQAKSGENKISGINDNQFLILNTEVFLAQISESKIIIIVRNPIDNSMSYWEHHQKMFRLRNNPNWLNPIKTNGELNKEKFVIEFSREWNKKISNIVKVSDKYPNRLMIVRYEDLVNDKFETLEKVFIFLNANSSATLLDDICKKSSLEKHRLASKNPEFYNLGRTNFGAGDLNENTISLAKNKSKDMWSLFYENRI